MAKKTRRTYHDIAESAANAIDAMEITRENFEASVPAIIAAFEGNADAWGYYDSPASGYWRNSNFWAVRTVRNSTTHGPALFASFKRK